MKIPHSSPCQKKRCTDQQLQSRDARTEQQAKEYLNTKLAENDKEGEVVGVLAFEPKARRINIYGPPLDESKLAYRLSTKASNWGLHRAEWRHLSRAYRQGYLVRRQEFDDHADPNEWVALVWITPPERFDREIVHYRP